MNYYEHHLGDYSKDAGHLSMIEHGAYRLLLDAYYIRETPLPTDFRECCKLARASTKAEKEAVEYVLREFFDLREGGYHQTRADSEITRFKDKQAKAKRSADARWNSVRGQSDGNANASPDAMRTHSEGNAHQSPVTKVHPISSSLRSEEIPPQPAGKKITFKTWSEAIKSSGEKAISDYRPVWDYAERVGIELDWIRIAWLKFSERYSKDPQYTKKKYIDWRQTFRNCVEGNWLGLWYAKDEKFYLTTVGVQADIETRKAA